MMCCFIFSN